MIEQMPMTHDNLASFAVLVAHQRKDLMLLRALKVAGFRKRDISHSWRDFGCSFKYKLNVVASLVEACLCLIATH